MGKKRVGFKSEASGASTTGKKTRSSSFVPDVAEMGGLSKGGVEQQQVVDDEPIHVLLHEYMQKGSAYSNTFSDKKLYAVLMTTAHKPNPLYQLMKQVGLHGASEAGRADGAPISMTEVEDRYKAIHQFVGKKTIDVDEIGWVRNRVGWYVDEAHVKDFLMWFDDLMAHRVDLVDVELDKIEGPLKIVIHMPSSGLLDLKFDESEDELKCKFELNKGQDFPMSIFELPPPIFPARLVTCNFEMVTDTIAHVIFGGNSKPFQAGFVRARVEGKSVKLNPDDAYGEYYRVMKDVDLANSVGAAAQLKNIFSDVLHGSPVVLRVKKTEHDLKNLKAVAALLLSDRKHIRIDF